MDLKKKLKRFFTLTRKANDGFTLVELIVVIAILAILAGVGTVGYGGYVKSAAKKADMMLVGNVVRAIETGTYSYSFTLNEVLQASDKGAKLPVGFVVLTPEGGQTMESASTKVAVTAKDACNITSVPLYQKTVAGTDSYNSGCNTESYTVYTVSKVEDAEICTVHSTLNNESVRVWDGVTSDTSTDDVNSKTETYALKEGSVFAFPPMDTCMDRKLMPVHIMNPLMMPRATM